MWALSVGAREEINRCYFCKGKGLKWLSTSAKIMIETNIRIAILTLPLNTNFGGIMQAFALQYVLERMGHSVKVIDKNYTPYLRNILPNIPIRLFRKYILKRNEPILHERLVYKRHLMLTINTEPFINKFINRRLVSDFSDLKRNEFDVLIIGSDQIWRPSYFSFFYKNVLDSFGAFADNWGIRRLSYAASFGTDKLNEFSRKEIFKIRRILQTFSGVSVREDDAVSLCKENFKVNAMQVLDPTLLVPQCRYVELIGDIPVRNGIMEYILDLKSNEKRILEYIGNVYQMPIFSTLTHIDEPQYSVEQWLAGFRDASFIVTDSFHACVFSIIFHKPFVVLINKDRGKSRILSLLKLFNLEHHLLSDVEQLKSIDSYVIKDDVYKTLNNWQQLSIKFLEHSIGQL